MNRNITVIGVGKLGLGFALLLEHANYNVLGVDIFPEYVEKLNKKTLVSQEPEYNELLQNATNFRATTNLQEGLNHSNILFIIVQTPNGGGERFYDHTILSNLLERINREKPKNKHIIIGCTVMPKYINEIGNELLKDCENTTLSYNPEFVAQGDIVRGFRTPDIILCGTTSDDVKEEMKEIYSRMTAPHTPKFCFMTPLEAEIVKIGLNGYITTKISFANMLSDVCDKTGANKERVLDAIGSDSRIGTKYFKPGYSFGGPCFPRDTKALNLFVKNEGICSDILTATTKMNEEHIVFQAEQMYNTQNTFMFSNVCYKENSKIPIIEESAKLKIACYLQKKYNSSCRIVDTPEIIREVKKEYGKKFEYEEIIQHE